MSAVAAGSVPGEYGPSSQDWVRAEVAHYERTGTGLRDRPVMVLATIGRRTGLLRKTPLMRVERLGSYAAVASMAGGAKDPAWYLNALADPQVQLQDGLLVRALVAREVSGAERSLWWSRACAVFPSYATYQSRTRRRIPVLVLEPSGGLPGGLLLPTEAGGG